MIMVLLLARIMDKTLKDTFLHKYIDEIETQVTSPKSKSYFKPHEPVESIF